MMVFICSNISALNAAVLPILGAASIFTTLLVALGYMLGELVHNPKITLWAKTEIFQVLISIVYVSLLWFGMQGFCAFNFASVSTLFGFNVGASSFTMFDAAQGYLLDGGAYIKDLIVVARYHLSAYNIFQGRSLWLCDESYNILFCIFGSALGIGGGTGIGVSPESGYAMAAAGMSVAFNSLLFSYVSTLNYLFILNYMYSGFIFFFLPFGIFLRSMPFLRGLGSLLMAMSLSFLFVYPMVLAIFYIDLKSNHVLNPIPSATFRGYINKENDLEGIGDLFANDFDTTLYDDIFGDNGGSVEFEVFSLSGNAFLIGVFVPTLALLAAVASTAYISRFLGQEIDLSRVVQMV